MAYIIIENLTPASRRKYTSCKYFGMNNLISKIEMFQLSKDLQVIKNKSCIFKC